MSGASVSEFRRRPGSVPLIFGHRGVRGPRPENTLAAFGFAADEGADGIELDVRLCGTGEVVVLHDADVAHVTQGADLRKAGALSLTELRQIKLGDQLIPTLGCALALAHERGLLVNIELKYDEPRRIGLVRAVARAIADSSLPRERVLISSFHPALLLIARRLLPDLGRAFICHYGQRRSRPFAFASAVGADAVHPEWPLLDAAHLRAAKRRGWLVGAWTVNDDAVARELAAAGVDSLITDRPGGIRRALVLAKPESRRRL